MNLSLPAPPAAGTFRWDDFDPSEADADEYALLRRSQELAPQDRFDKWVSQLKADCGQAAWQSAEAAPFEQARSSHGSTEGVARLRLDMQRLERQEERLAEDYNERERRLKEELQACSSQQILDLPEASHR